MCEYRKKDDEKIYETGHRACKKGLGWTNPNPMVGAVIVKDGKVIGEGYHKKYGELHAETTALKTVQKAQRGQRYM